MTFNIGVVIGPILGGILSDLAGSYPTVFGDVKFFRDYPYATPNILSAFFLLCAVLSVWLNLEEVSTYVQITRAPRAHLFLRPWMLGEAKEISVSKLGGSSRAHCEHASGVTGLQCGIPR